MFSVDELRNDLLCSVLSLRYNLYGANKDLKAVFGDVDRFIRYISLSSSRQSDYVLIIIFLNRWRVALMERGIAKMDLEAVDQMVQVHGMSPL